MELRDIIKSEWKVIDEFPSYLVNNKGEIFSIHSNKLLDINVNSKGYAFVVLRDKKQSISKTKEIHRIVAKYFLDNPNPIEFTQVNHKDENPLNNNVSNLEWCTPKYNSNYGTRNQKIKDYFNPIVQCDLEGNRIRVFLNNQYASIYTGCNHSAISKARTGVNSMCGGFKWKSPTLDEIKKLKEAREKDSTIYYIFIDEKRNQK
jgi:hypothetical protein